MSQSENQSRNEKPPDYSSVHQNVSSTQRPRPTGSERPIPSSTSMPVNLTSRSQPADSNTGQRQHSQDETPLNPLYHMTASSSEDTGLQAMNNQKQTEQRTSPSEESQESSSSGNLRERKLVKQMSEEFIQPVCPKVNCPEKIVICLDISDELNKVTFRSRAGDKFSPMKLLKRALGFFLNSKHNLDSRHEFALCLFQDVAYWATDFTSNPRDIISYIEDLVDNKPAECFDMDTLFETIYERVSLPKIDEPAVYPPPYTVRCVLFYGRSHCVPTIESKENMKLLQASPHLFVDAFYIHEIPSHENKCEEVYDMLCKLDTNGLSYIFEVSKSVTKLYDCMAQLLPHPLQRPIQPNARYNILDSGGELAP